MGVGRLGVSWGVVVCGCVTICCVVCMLHCAGFFRCAVVYFLFGPFEVDFPVTTPPPGRSEGLGAPTKNKKHT